MTTEKYMNMLRHFYNDFMAFVPLQLPQLLDVTTPVIKKNTGGLWMSLCSF